MARLLLGMGTRRKDDGDQPLGHRSDPPKVERSPGVIDGGGAGGPDLAVWLSCGRER